MNTCIGLFNGKDSVLITDGRVTKGSKLVSEQQNRIFDVTESVSVAFSGSPYLYLKLKVFLQGLDDSVLIVKSTSYAALGTTAKEYAESCVDSFLCLPDADAEETLVQANHHEAEFAIRIIWEYFVNWIDDCGDISINKEDTAHIFTSLWSTPVGIFEVDTEGYVSHGDIKVIGNLAALGCILADTIEDDCLFSAKGCAVDKPDVCDRTKMYEKDIHEMEMLGKRAINIISLIDSNTGSGCFISYNKGVTCG